MEIGHPSSAWLVGLLFAISTPVWSAENFLSNPTTPYPPGCATNYPLVLEMPGTDSDIHSATVYMYEADEASSQHEVAIRIWRRGCSESDRSLLFFEMSVVDDGDGITEAVLCPDFEADVFGIIHKLQSYQSCVYVVFIIKVMDVNKCFIFILVSRSIIVSEIPLVKEEIS